MLSLFHPPEGGTPKKSLEETYPMVTLSAPGKKLLIGGGKRTPCETFVSMKILEIHVILLDNFLHLGDIPIMSRYVCKPYKPALTMFSVRLEKQFVDAIKQRAKKAGESEAAVIRGLVQKAFMKNDPRNLPDATPATGRATAKGTRTATERTRKGTINDRILSQKRRGGKSDGWKKAR